MSEINSEINYEDLKLGDVNDEGKSVLISDLADRPNSFNSYSKSNLSAHGLKEVFDRSFIYVKTKFNELMDRLARRDVDIDGRLDKQDAKIKEVYEAYENGEFKGDAYVITEADKEEIADISIETLRNEFDEALDAIIAIQKELMDEITFTIFHASTSVEETLTAREKMTWREWCDSEYNTIGAYALNDSNSAIIMHDAEGGTHYIHYKYNAPEYIEARADDIIEEGHEYYCPDWGGVSYES